LPVCSGEKPGEADVALLRRLGVVAIFVLSGAAPAAAQEATADFYRGKTVTLVIGTGPGGAYDIHGRLLARHLAQHIPGVPKLVVQNIPGAGSVQAANYVFNIAPQDGTVLGNILNTLPIVQLLGLVKTQFEVAQFQWIGNMTEELSVMVAWHTAKAATLEQAKSVQLLMGSTSPGSLGAMFPKIANLVLGTKFRNVSGYNDAVEIDHAMELGEVDGRAGETWYGDKGVYGAWYRDGKIRILMQVGPHKAADLPAVPLMSELAREGDAGRILELFNSPSIIGKPTVVGPRVPAAQVATLRKAYDETVADPEFRADAERLGIVLEPVSGPHLAALVAHLAQTPAPLLATVRKAVE
jgi:tripartite-type tricarboxylate transporter receptor subunit TctC